jgi:phosphotransferase system enzyme I (PtsI)
MLPLAHREHNPFLGWRGIRVLLDRPELLRPQLRALLRASVHGPLQILLPMVTHLDEIFHFKDILHDVRSALRHEGHDVPSSVPVGAMVEVPAVALRPDGFASEVDFFSIGTNDLTQYVLAVDRSNDMVADRYDALHPAVLTLIQRTVEGAREHDIPVSLCGEIGSVPHAIPILLGLGLDAISASPTYLPPIKRVIRSIQLADATALAADVLTAADVGEVHALNAAWLRNHAPEALEDLAYPPVS